MEAKLLFVALCLALAASCAGKGKPVTSREGSSTNRAQTNDLQVDGLVKIGDAPALDSPSARVQCVDERFCWINTPRLIWRSTDGGMNWQEIYRAPQDDEIRTCNFVRSDIGWLISTHKLLVSNDGGFRWTEKGTPLKDPKGEMRSLWFHDEKTGWLAGGLFRPQSSEEREFGVPPNAKDTSGPNVLQQAIYQTTDGGDSWQPRSLIMPAVGRIMRIQFLNEQRGLALGQHRIYVTTDGGTGWQSNFQSWLCPQGILERRIRSRSRSRFHAER